MSFSPWLVLSASAAPAVITITQTSTVQANLTFDSAGGYHDPALGHVPDNIPVSFAVASGSGSVSGGYGYTAAGIAQTLFTSSATGTAQVTATIDSQTVPVLIEITGAIAVSSSENPSTVGDTVTFTATVTPSTATGTVQFKIDGSFFGSPVPLSGGSATSGGISTLAVGTHTVEADYSGDTNNAASSGTLSQTVLKEPSTTTVSSSANPSVYGQSVTFTATVSGGGAKPTGTVTFKDGTTTLGTGTLSGGSTTFSTSALSVATHAITAEYSDDGTHDVSTGTLSGCQVVNQASSSTSVSTSGSPSTLGASVTFTATVSAVSPGTGTPSGTVTFKDGADTLGTGGPEWRDSNLHHLRAFIR